MKIINAIRLRRVSLALTTLCCAGVCPPAGAIEIKKNDSIVILGNTFAERLQLFGYFETYLHCKFPDHRLRIRNMGWSADEVERMIRPLGFPKLSDELREHEADIIFVCLGMNESFQGEKGVQPFRDALTKLVKDLLKQQFNGHAPAKIVLVSPIAHENLGGDLPDGVEHNRDLRLYTEAMQQVAREVQAEFVDLFTPTAEWMANHTDQPLTFNGIHLTEYGDRVVSQMWAQRLGLVEDAATTTSNRTGIDKFRRAVYVKNYQYFQWWHPPNASYIHGRRNDTPGAKHMAMERQQHEQLITACEEDVWAMTKPAPSAIWQLAPDESEPICPIWFPTPADRPIPGIEKEAQWAVPEDGDADPHIRSTEEQLKLLKVPDGYEVNLFAAEDRFPIANPMAIQFDARGRLWVANTPTWPHPLPGKQPQDSLIILEDTNRDGVADQHSVFVDNLNLIHGFALGGGGAYISQTPHLLLARDTDANDEADWFRIVLHGFGAEDAEHSMNNFCWSPGGSLFFSQGVFFHTQVETPTGPVRVRDAGVFRYRPNEHNLGIYASHELWNPYGNLFGRWGRGILLDASAGQYYPMDVISANFVYPKQKERTDHLSFAPAGSIASGCDWLYSRHFPDDVQGRFLVNRCEGDVGTHWYTVKPNGSNYTAEQHTPSLLTSEDKTFRPIAMTVGPDGALYIADFYSHIFENVMFSKRHPGRDHTHGRIWRVSNKSRPLLTPPQFNGQPVPALLDLLKSYEDTTREFARRELQNRGRDVVVPHLEKWVGRLDDSDSGYEHHLIEALWVHQSLNALNVDLLKRLLRAKDPGARVAATHVLRFWQDRIDDSLDLLRTQVNDEDARVRLHAVLACGFSKRDGAMEVALEAANHDMDAGLEHALDDTLRYFERIAEP